jgi:histidinol-phosphatase (PHP family)
MKLVNYHTHSSFCDGILEPEEYVKAAIDMGFGSLGFSSHAPVPFVNRWSIKPERMNEYAFTIRELKKKYQSKIDVYLSLEIDYIPGISRNISEFKKLFSLDYTIGGIHLVKSPDSEKLWFIDGPPENYDIGLIEVFEMDIHKAVRCYFSQLQEMIEQQKPDIIAHFDKIKMNNRGLYFSTDEKWYRNHIHETIKIIAANGQIVEVNTRGIYKKRCSELYPAVWILEELNKLDVPGTVSSDSHKPDELILQVPETLQILKEIGFRGIMIYNGNGWKKKMW